MNLRILVLFLWLASICLGYKPVYIIHGILDKQHSLDTLVGYITKYHPGTNVTIGNAFHGWKSIVPMWTQARHFAKSIQEIANTTNGGIHLIGYSQGGLVARGILSAIPDHNVDTFVSLSSPQMGQYGDTSYFKLLFPNYVRTNLYKVLYTNYGQQLSLGNYWNDPHHQDIYQKSSRFLAVLNNDTYNPNSEQMKRNFLRINRMVLIGGPNDGVITPWQSSHFGYYDDNETIVEMTSQRIFKEDSFGLNTLYRRKVIQTYVVPGVEHLQWHRNETVFKDCILPWLT